MQSEHRKQSSDEKRIYRYEDSELSCQDIQPDTIQNLDPASLKSKRFYSEEKYHYLDNKEKIEGELSDFKSEIERKFKKSET